ncbi:unnamed protein product, partial [Rotaria magnacalcarata]
MHIIHTYSGSCELCTCNGNPTISIVCSRLTPVIEASLTGLSPM